MSRPVDHRSTEAAQRTGRGRRIGITGLSGYLGERLAVAVRVAGHHPVDLGRANGLDLLDPGSVREVVTQLAPDAVIHAAAANPGRPEDSFDAVNRVGSAAVAEATTDIGARLVHVSTDLVLSGRAAPYGDDAAADPLGVYGRSKAGAEAEVQRIDPTAAIVRTSLIYGLHRIDRSTAGFLDRLRRGEPLELFADVVRQPVWVDALAEGLVRLAVEFPEVSGTLNLAGDQALDRAAFGRRMLARWGLAPAAFDRIVDGLAGPRLPGVALDLRLGLERARALGLACPGVDEVLARAGTVAPPGRTDPAGAR